MKYTITGDNLQFVNVQLEDGESIQSQGGAMRYMTGNVRMETKAKGGFLKGFKRSLSGDSFFLVRYEATGGSGVVGFGGGAPGKIVDVDVSQGAWTVQRSGHLCSEETVDIDMAFQNKMGSAFFGGEGLVLQRLSGTGIAFIAACGDFNIIDLRPGEKYKVSTSNAVAWQDTVSYDIESVGGIKNALFSGEGLFVTTLTGPGKIIIQSMTLQDLAMSLLPFIPRNN